MAVELRLLRLKKTTHQDPNLQESFDENEADNLAEEFVTQLEELEPLEPVETENVEAENMDASETELDTLDTVETEPIEPDVVDTTETELDATESLQVKVNVKGKGNLKLFKLPKISLPSSLEVYEPEHSESIKTNLTGMQGSISDSYTVVPQFKGKYPIPSISFSYFDLKTETYKRLSSEEIVIDVLSVWVI